MVIINHQQRIIRPLRKVLREQVHKRRNVELSNVESAKMGSQRFSRAGDDGLYGAREVCRKSSHVRRGRASLVPRCRPLAALGPLAG